VLIVLRGEVDAIDDGTSDAVDGFAELIAGTASFADVIYQDTASRTHIIPRGASDIAMDEIDADEFGFLIDALEQTYDRVIVSVGPLGADLGTVDLLHNADSVVLAVSPGIDDKWGLAAFETLTAHGFGHVFVASEPVGSALSPAA
jgi:polysaccharide biosynthesis transport protein